jgi:signal transduction histidine kinase
MATNTMAILNILLVEDDPVRRAKIEEMILSIPDTFDLEVAASYEEAIKEFGVNKHDAYLVSREFSDDRGLEAVWEISGQGCQGPALVLANDDNPELESEAVNLGAMIYLVRDQLNPRFLERMIRHAIDRKRYEDNIRNNQEDLIKRMMDLQDSSERFEAQSVEYVQMAEDLAIAQGELEAALADVTQSKQELEVLNKEKDRFFSIIAHDLRSPFTSLLGYTGMIALAADKMTPEKIVESAININESANRLFALLENLLEWARLQMDQIPSEPDILEIHDLVGKTTDVLAPVGADKDVRVENKVAAGVHAFADSHMVDTVIRNLTNNAIKFTAAQGVVSVDGRNHDGVCEIAVSDTGVGMTQKQIDKLFSIGDKNSTKGTGGEAGTGLGLLLCKDLLEKCNGSMVVESEPGKGSTFSITLPASG